MISNTEYKNKKVLITGGLGFIGSNLAIRLAGLGAEVTLIDSMISQYGGNKFNIIDIKDKVHINYSDVRDGYSMNHLIRDKDYLFNLAGQVSHIDSMTDPLTDLEINSKSQLSILEACRKSNPGIRIIFTSTRQVYGIPQQLPINESHPLNPADINGINKISGERYHLLYSRVYGVRCVVLRLTNTYGPRQLVKHDKQGFMGWFVRQIVRGEKINIFGDGKQLRDLNFVDDVVDALLAVGINEKAYGEVFNLGSDKPVSLKELVELMIGINGKGAYEFVPFPEEKKKIDIGSVYADFKKIKKAIGWSPKVSLEEGLKETFEFYRKYGEHYW
ncbi:MAG: NAD-dependent epimerase/dehydratase family protein [Candidatus Omnitrophota bacterium]